MGEDKYECVVLVPFEPTADSCHAFTAHLIRGSDLVEYSSRSQLLLLPHQYDTLPPSCPYYDIAAITTVVPGV